ncbi:MAG: hypothetical protein ACI8P3_002701, partial [Saprospiraceae bacterium]
MKKHILIIALAIFVIMACTVFLSDGFTYLVASLMAIIAIGII